ncbi:ROK family transcriptional regulator [Chelatococcus sp. SYSU_G07232]|uniref:ROK family transcriptional regulator n=1 Tax=Chelatococcus albus TaxID=3047466 RepID=A0ABT7AKX9_9HYPH|nr:ROK family transcriptional regulator [Chelatococcus sp. SYSU_G07232]MDJ1160032.1 ROK family transcriptional regulator [Chelatococcus sp. SYSU_G07232]
MAPQPGSPLRGSNQALLRAHNRRVALDVLRRVGRASRADLARLTGLTAQAVANIIEELAADGLVREVGRRRTRAGQPPVDFELAPDGAFTIGLHLRHDRVTGVVVDLVGRRLAVADRDFGDPNGPEAPAGLARLAVDLAEQSRVEPRRLWGVGLAVPGPFDVDAVGIRSETAMPPWTDGSAVARLREVLAMPVFLENDATAAALGERLYGCATAIDDFLFIFIGRGLGAGLFLGGQPVRGAFGNAGELGHVSVAPAGKPCYCGSHGCLERYVSLHAAYEACGEGGLAVQSPQALARAYRMGEPVVHRWLDTAAEHLRRAVQTVENLIDPATIIVGGDLAEDMLAALAERAEPLHPSVSARRDRMLPRLMQGSSGPAGTAMGAAALPLMHQVAAPGAQPFGTGPERAAETRAPAPRALP